MARDPGPLDSPGRPPYVQPMNDSRVVRFGAFRFNPATGDVTGPVGTRRLQPQPATVLALLVSRPGALVTREELRQRIWPDTRVEFDQGINFCIRQIRTALDERAEAPVFIETLPRRGYRFLAEVEREAPAGTDVTAPRPAVTAGAHPARRSRRTGVLLPAGIALFVVAGLLARRPPAGQQEGTAGIGAEAAGAPAKSDRALEVRLALLPLTDPENPSALAAFNRALGDALVVEFTAADEGRWGVVGPLTTGTLLEDGITPAQLGARTGSAFVLSGGVRAADSTVFLQAVRQADGVHVFARRLRLGARTPGDLAAELAAAAVAAIREGRPAPDDV